MPLTLLNSLRDIALVEYSHIVVRAELLFAASGRVRKLRVHVVDESFVDIWLSGVGDYAFHWERRLIDGSLYRHDNAPHVRWSSTSTFPKHFHNGSEDNVQDSSMSDSPAEAFREFMEFVASKL